MRTKRKDKPQDQQAPEAFDDSVARFVAAFSRTSAIELAIYDDQLRFRLVNDAAAAITGIPAPAYVGQTMPEIIGDAALAPEARLREVLLMGESPVLEVAARLPMRTELGYWIQKSFPIKGWSGRVTQIASLAVEVTAHRKLEYRFRELGGELLWRNGDYQRLARERHDSVNGYHAALGMSLDRLSRETKNPERIPELLAQPMEVLNQRMQKLASAVANCFPTDRQH